jgi:PAS domain S-box-containing protein
MDTHGSDYLQLLNHSPLTVIVSDEKDQLIFANVHAKETFGFDHQAAQTTNVRKFHSKHPESWNVIKQKAKTKGTYAFESIAKKQTGGIIDIWVICDSINFKGEPAFAVFIRDISDQQIIIKEHFKERQFRQLILDSIPAMVFVKDKENRIIAMNKAYQETTGYSIEKYLGRKISDFMTDKELADQYWKDDLEVMQTGLPKETSSSH